MSSTDPQPSITPAATPPSRPGLIGRTIRRHWPWMLAVWLVGSIAAGYFAWVFIRPSYQAISLLRVEPAGPDLFVVRPAVDPLDPFLQTQVQLITSPNVLTAAGTDPKAAVLERVQKAGDVVQELRKAVSVSVLPNTYLIQVSMTSANAYEAATIVNAVVNAFIEANNEWSDGMTRTQIKNLEQYSTDLKNQTDELERKWLNLAAKADADLPAPDGGKVDPGGQRLNLTIEEFRQVRQELNSVKLEMAQAEAWVAAAKAAANRAAEKAITAEEERNFIDQQVERKFKLDPEIQTLLTKMSKAEARVSDARRLADNPDDPLVTKAKRQYEDLSTQYKQSWDAKSPAIREQIERGGDPEREVREATSTVNKLRAKQSALATQLDQINLSSMKRATDAVQIELIRDERATLKGMLDQVTRRLEQLRYEARGEARVRLVNANGALVPTRPISDKRVLIVSLIPLAVLMPVLGLVIGLAGITGPKAGTAMPEPKAKV